MNQYFCHFHPLLHSGSSCFSPTSLSCLWSLLQLLLLHRYRVMLSPFSVVSMCMRFGLTAWDRLTYWGLILRGDCVSFCQQPLIGCSSSSRGQASWDPPPMLLCQLTLSSCRSCWDFMVTASLSYAGKTYFIADILVHWLTVFPPSSAMSPEP